MQNVEPRLFISYSSKDIELVDRLAKDLTHRGIQVLYDRNLIEVGDDWKSKLTEALLNADCVLVLITFNSLSSSYVMNELGMAVAMIKKSESQKLLLPVVVGEVNIPIIIQDIKAIFWRDNYEEVIENITFAFFSFIERRKEKISNSIKTKKQYKDIFEETIASKEVTEEVTKGRKRTARKQSKELSTKEENLKQKVAPISESAGKRNHWLLKMNPQTWEIEQLKVNDETFFSTHYLEEKRPEYPLFKKIKSGDYVLGFAAGSYQSIVCEMEVVKPVGPNHKQGESFTMVVKRLIAPPIPLTEFKDKIADILPRLENNIRPLELFFELSEDEYTLILSSGGREDESFEHIYQPFFLTEGNHSSTRDQLDFENDYNSFASVIALKRVNPPLAIGLFGNWGSGKSFFMEKLSERIEEIAESNDPEYIKNVVSVKFNSWHYSDTNLWASLITQIFENLNDYAQKKAFGQEAIEAIYKDLNITGYQLEEINKKLADNEALANALKQQKDNKEETIRRKKETLNLWRTRDFIKIVLSDPFIQNDFEDIKEQFRAEKLIENIGEIEKKYTEIDSVANKVWKSFVLLKENRKGKWIWVWILAALCGIACYLALGPWREIIENFVSGALVATGLVLAWLTNLIIKLSPYFEKVTQFYKRLKSLKETIEKEKEKVNLKEHDEVRRLQKDIDELTQERAKLESEYKLAEERQAKLQNDIKEIGSGKLLADFLAAKSAEDIYIKQLGIISWIRRDFSKLNELFKAQQVVQLKENDTAPAVQIDRIVLYIDDLDRCNEDVVVKVLEAIHLLLAFPLFVVVVGVDPRWLNNALSKKYEYLFGDQASKNSEKEKSAGKKDERNTFLGEAATTYDYLEKIFQIPFALKPINKTGREKLIQYLIKDEMEDTIKTTTESTKLPTPDQVLDKAKQLETLSVTSPTKVEVSTKDEKIPVPGTAKERLVFSDAELKYMQRISPLFGHTPRTINRYINIYRIIKAHGSLRVIESFSEDEFMPIMFILGVVVGHASHAEEFLAEVAKTSDNMIFQDFLKTKKLNKNLVAAIKPLASDIKVMYMENFKRNLELISRFSFRILLK